MSSKLSALATATYPLATTDVFYVVQGGASKQIALNAREVLTAARTYYVRSDGSDSNTGLVNSAGGAWLTYAYAISFLAGYIDFGGRTVTLSVQNTAWTAAFSIATGFVGGGTLSIDFNGGSIDPNSNANSFEIDGPTLNDVNLANVILQNSGTGIALSVGAGANLNIGAGVSFGPTTSNYHVSIAGTGTYVSWGIIATSSYNISGDALIHIVATNNAVVDYFATTVTATGGTRNFSAEFIAASTGAVISSTGTTFSGTFTGKRYVTTTAGGLEVFGGGVNYYPGDVAGTATTPGWYE